jgi:sugar/nucleoside kinase (ribokinase family)
MSKGIFLGLITADIVYYVPHHPSNNQKLKAELQQSFAGGPATNAAVTFAALGNKASLVTGLGRHLLARIVKKDLAEHQVELLDGSDQPKRPPILSAIMVDLSTGERSIVSANSDFRNLRQDSINESILEDADILMLDGYYLPQAIQMAQWARQRDIPVVLDGGSWKQGLEALLPFVDYAVCSNVFAPPKSTDSASVIAYLKNVGIENIAITRDDEPIIAHFKGETTEIPVMRINPVDTLGAGDIFHGAFCHYLLQNDFLVSLERAGEIASMSCTSLGTRAWIDQDKFI